MSDYDTSRPMKIPSTLVWGEVAEWLGIYLRVQIPAASLLSATLGKFFTHTCDSVTRQYNLVLANGQ